MSDEINVKETVGFEVALKRDGKLVFAPKGSSMLPMLDGERDIVVILPVDDTSSIKKYDVIFYKRANGNYVLHRVIKVNKDHFKCCGDNQAFSERVDPSCVFGKLEGFYKDLRYVDVNTDENYKRYAKKAVRARVLKNVRARIVKMLKK